MLLKTLLLKATLAFDEHYFEINRKAKESASELATALSSHCLWGS